MTIDIERSKGWARARLTLTHESISMDFGYLNADEMRSLRHNFVGCIQELTKAMGDKPGTNEYEDEVLVPLQQT